MSASAGKAVFLSYSHEDQAAARKIAEALRAAGVEVWFDLSELRGGDAWDRQIRQQIKECALFLAVISAHTQARHEGYFRLEWKLAAQRTYLIADGTPFLLPIVVDTTAEPEALVPDEFRQVQWLVVGNPESVGGLVERVRTLLNRGSATPIRHRATAQAGGARRRNQRGIGGWSWAGIALGVIAAAVIIGQFRRAPETSFPPPEAPKTDEASRLVAQARELIYEIDSGRTEFALAESLVKRAAELAPDRADVWALSALLNIEQVTRSFDPSDARSTRARADAEKALRLDGQSLDALIAMGQYQRRLGEPEVARRLLEQAREAHPKEARVHVEISRQIPNMRERMQYQKQMAEVVTDNRELLYHASNQARGQRLWGEAVELSDRVLKQNPVWRAYVGRAITEYAMTADPAKVSHWLDQIPPLKRDEPRAVIMRYFAEMLRRDGRAAEAALRRLPSEDVVDSQYSGPRSFLLAQARDLGGRGDPALGQWRLAEEAFRERLKKSPDSVGSRNGLAIALAAQGKRAEALEIVDAFVAQRGFSADIAQACVLLDDPARAIAMLHRGRRSASMTVAVLCAEPRWEPLKKHPEFGALVRAFAEVDKLPIPSEYLGAAR